MSEVLLDRSAFLDRVAGQGRARLAMPDRHRVKVNLYTPDEVQGLADALSRPEVPFGPEDIDCLMVADSYLMTHLGRDSTRLGPYEQAAFLDTLCHLVEGVAQAAEAAFTGSIRPWILGDMPDGAAITPARAINNARRLCDAGADAVKLELGSAAAWDALAGITDAGIPAVAHLGYQPTFNDNRRYGSEPAEAALLISGAADAARMGAFGLVLERVDPGLVTIIAAPGGPIPLVWSIFCGTSAYAGYSLNVWDAVIRPPTPRRGFPASASLDAAAYPERYTVPTIADHLAAALGLIAGDDYPAAIPSRLSDQEVAELRSLWLSATSA